MRPPRATDKVLFRVSATTSECLTLFVVLAGIGMMIGRRIA